jgi:RNA polymerase sigma-70 factor (sigma-E family)
MKRTEWDATYTEYVVARQGRLRRAAYAITGDWHRAEDLLQQALTKLYVVWPRLIRSGGEDAYVRRILMSTHLDEVRRPWRRRETPGLDDRDEPDAGQPSGVEDRDELITALQALPLMQRKVVVGRHLLDLPIDEVAACLGISPGTVKSHNSRGLARLAEILEDTPCST